MLSWWWWLLLCESVGREGALALLLIAFLNCLLLLFALQYLDDNYGLACEHVHSCCILIADKRVGFTPTPLHCTHSASLMTDECCCVLSVLLLVVS